jgi:hypothetical protein
MSINARLSVIVPTRDRNILTLKAIESVRKTSKLFKEINIFVFDNLTNPSQERINIFSKLLSDGHIQYYSYDTKTSLNDCFAKAIVFQRWIDMMKTSHELNKYTDKEKLEDFYLLLDSDMIVGEGWDRYFITANKDLNNIEPDLHFFVKFIGGIPKSAREHPTTRTHTIKYKEEEFKVMCSVHGGGSGFWFFNFSQLCKLKWPIEGLLNTYGKFKRQDTTSWALIKKKFNMVPTRYVAGVIPPDKENPLVLHMGEVLKCSMCNVLNNLGSKVYNREKHNFSLKELELKDMSAKEIYDKYKMLDSATIW